MMAALAYYRSAGCALEKTARRALAVASAAVTCSGSQPPSMDRILPLIDRIQLQYL